MLHEDNNCISRLLLKLPFVSKYTTALSSSETTVFAVREKQNCKANYDYE